MLMARYMSPKDPDPIFLTSLYFPPTMNSVLEPLLLAIMSTKWQFPLGSPSEIHSNKSSAEDRVLWVQLVMNWELDFPSIKRCWRLVKQLVKKISQRYSIDFQANVGPYKGFHKNPPRWMPHQCPSLLINVCIYGNISKIQFVEPYGLRQPHSLLELQTLVKSSVG